MASTPSQRIKQKYSYRYRHSHSRGIIHTQSQRATSQPQDINRNNSTISCESCQTENENLQTIDDIVYLREIKKQGCCAQQESPGERRGDVSRFEVAFGHIVSILFP